ncbi:MAG: radical SAM protein [Lentisphaerae bacterium]|nr:radical SAM protein [Lentisphaerota bacterium]
MFSVVKNLFSELTVPISGNIPDLLPESFILELTKSCNLNCPYCYCLWHEFPCLADRDLTAGDWQKIILFLVERQVASFSFTGGEVLMRSDLKQIITYTRNLLPQGRLSLFTNGILLNDAWIEYFREKKVYLSTSLQGLKSYAAMTGSTGQAEHILDVLRVAAALQWPMAVSMTITQANKSEVCTMFETAVAAGANSIQLGAMMPQGRGKQHLELALSRAEWEEVKNAIRNMKDCGIPFSFCDEMICKCRKHPADIFDRFHQKVPVKCNAGKDLGVISPNGTYHKCLHFFEE